MQASLGCELPDFRKAAILVVGDVMLDRYWFGETSRISPEAPVPVVHINNLDERPGGAGNVALNIAALGANVTLLGRRGNDDAGHLLHQQLQAASVNTQLHMEKGIKTIVKLRVISKHQQLIRLDFEEPITPLNTNLLYESFIAHLNRCHLVVLSDYQKGTLSTPQTFIQLAKEKGVPVIVDPKSNDFSRYANATIVTPNFNEFIRVVGPCQTEAEMIHKGRQLLSQFKLEALLVTRGEQGMTLIQQEQVMHYPAYAREVLDVTGAGDTVVSVLGCAIAAGMSFSNATAVANLAASLVVAKLGATTISVPELEVALTGRPQVNNGIVNEEQLLQAVNEARAAGKKVVFTNGCFDILHAGHVTCLQLARALGDHLIVAVNADESVRALKGNSRPINHLDHRMIVLAGLGVVDWVVPFSDLTPERLLKKIKPDVLVKGGDYKIDQIVGADVVKAYGGKVRIVDSNITSSSKIIKRIIHLEQNSAEEIIA